MLTLEKILNRTFQDSPAWKSAHELTLAVYQITVDFPRLETFGLIHELRRSATAVAANLAEGYGRNSWGDLRRCATNANGCLEETKYFLLLASELGFMEPAECDRLTSLAVKTGSLIAEMDRRPQHPELFPQ